TFFGMLGNFSFGDYFKRDAIPFAWKLLTEEWKLPADRLWATIFHGDATTPRDDEAYDIWKKFLPTERIGELGAADNFWQMGDTADHMRAMTFLIADGVVPSNEWRGYVLRKIMRRAMRHGKRLGVSEPILYSLVDVIVREFGDAYPELKAGQSAIAQVIRTEEERFDAVLTDGLPRLEE